MVAHLLLGYTTDVDCYAPPAGCLPRLKKHVTRSGMSFWIFGEFFIPVRAVPPVRGGALLISALTQVFPR